MSGREKPDAPGLWRDANEKTVVACMESGELRMRDPDTGMVLSGEWVERAAPFRQAEWKGTKLIGAGFSAMPDTAGCWCDANGTLWLITGGDVIDGHIFRLKEPGREWECAPCFGITVRMLHEWGPWTRCDFNPKDDEAVRFDWCKPWIADHGWDDDMSEPASSLLARIKEIRKSLPEENGLWRFEHAGSGVIFGDGGGKRLFLFDSGGGFLDGGLGPCTRLRLGIPVGSAPIPNLPGVWMDKDGNLLAVSGERRVRIWNNHDWMAEELDDDSGEPSAHGPYTRYSLQTVEEVPWKPESGDSTPIHEGSRTVHLPDVRSFGRLERDKWLAVKNLEESAELVEACKQYLKACDPTDPSGIGREFDDHANCLACYGVNVGGELGDDWDKAKTGWIGHVRDQRRQAMLDELADVLQTVGNLITAFGITDEEVGRAMDDCLERNRRKGRL